MEPAPVPSRIGTSTWPCRSCGAFFELAGGWRVVHRLGGVEWVAYVCQVCAERIQRGEQEHSRR